MRSANPLGRDGKRSGERADGKIYVCRFSAPPFSQLRYEKKLADLDGSAADPAFLKAHKGLFGLLNVQRGLEVTCTNRSDDGRIYVLGRQFPCVTAAIWSPSSSGAVRSAGGDYDTALALPSVLKSRFRLMRRASRVLAVLALCALAASLVGCDLFGSGEEGADVSPSLIEGEYDPRYVVRFEDIDAPEGQDPKSEYRGKLFCVFFGEREIWDCQPRAGQPVTAGGSYKINSDRLVLYDEYIKRQNFNWGLSPDSTYAYKLDGDRLTLTQSRAGAPYPGRIYHRIVLVRRDTSEYQYLSKQSIDKITPRR